MLGTGEKTKVNGKKAARKRSGAHPAVRHLTGQTLMAAMRKERSSSVFIAALAGRTLPLA